MKKTVIIALLSLALFSITPISAQQAAAAYNGSRQGVNAAAVAIGVGVVVGLGVVGIIVNNNSNSSGAAHSH